jgi:hypothetical protein
MIMKSRLKFVAAGMLIVFLLSASPVLGTLIKGGVGSRIQMNFMYQDPDPADAGKYLDVRWQIVNTVSGALQNLTFRLDAEYPFLFEAGDTPDKYLGDSAGTNVAEVYYILHYRLKVADNALKGTYNVTLGWTATGEGWTWKDFPIHIDPKRSDFVVGALVTSPEKLIADTDEAKLSVNIDNIGKGKAENVKVKLLLPLGFKPSFGYSDEDSLGIIEKDGSKKANFYVDVAENVTEGEYNATLVITYRDENDESNTYRTKTLALIIPIKPAPHLIAESVTSDPEIITPGNKAELHIKVKNNGNKKAESVSLRVFKDASQPFEFGEKSDFVGKLEPGESGDAVIRLTVDKNAAAKKYLLDVELRGVDEAKNTVIFRRTVPITVNPETRGSPLITFGILGGLIVIGAAAVYYLKKKGK